MNMKDYPTLAIPLTDTERDTLQTYETYLTDHLPVFFKVGQILVDIRNQKLYRESYQTFEAYCKEKWNIGRSRAYQLMDAADVQEELSTACGQDTPLPTSEAQARALKKAPSDIRPTAWTNAVNAAGGQQPTAPQVTQAVLELTPPEQNTEYEPHTQRKIVSVVCECGNEFKKPEDNPVVLCGDCVSKKLAQKPKKQVLHTVDVQQGKVIETRVIEKRESIHHPDELKKPVVEWLWQEAGSTDSGEVEDYLKRILSDPNIVGETPMKRLRKHLEASYLLGPINFRDVCKSIDLADIMIHRDDTRDDPKPADLRRVIKGFMSCRHDEWEDAVEELNKICNAGGRGEVFWELYAHCKNLFVLSDWRQVFEMCHEALKEWRELQDEREARNTSEPEADTITCDLNEDVDNWEETAPEILDSIEHNTEWVNAIVKRVADSKYFPYETTDQKLFREVTIRKPTGQINRFGEEKLKRYRLDGVSVIKINDHRYEPVIVGLEVKISKSDLMNDTKMQEYLDYCDFFFLTIPRHLGFDAKTYISQHPQGDRIGMIIVECGEVEIHEFRDRHHISDRQRHEITTELLMKSLWKEARQQHTRG